MNPKILLLGVGAVGLLVLISKKGTPSDELQGITEPTFNNKTLYIPTSAYDIDVNYGSQSSTVNNGNGQTPSTPTPVTPPVKTTTPTQPAKATVPAKSVFNVKPQDLPELKRKAELGIKVTNTDYQDEWEVLRKQTEAEIIRKAKSGVQLSNTTSTVNNALWNKFKVQGS